VGRANLFALPSMCHLMTTPRWMDGRFDLSTGQLTILPVQRAEQHRRLSGDDLTVGQIGSAAYFGLLGNPVAALVTFLFVVRDALLQLAGANPKKLVTVPMRCAHALR